MGRLPGISRGVRCNHKGIYKRETRSSDRECNVIQKQIFQDATLLALKMEREPQAEERQWLLEDGKGKEMD